MPAMGRHFAYISSGTWSLAGVELSAPVLTPEASAPTSPTKRESTGPSATCAM
jgi:rhamnulokinase